MITAILQRLRDLATSTQLQQVRAFNQCPRNEKVIALLNKRSDTKVAEYAKMLIEKLTIRYDEAQLDSLLLLAYFDPFW